MLHWSISEKTLARKQVSLRCRRCASSQLRVQGHLVYMETWGLSLLPLLRSFMAQCPQRENQSIMPCSRASTSVDKNALVISVASPKPQATSSNAPSRSIKAKA